MTNTTEVASMRNDIAGVSQSTNKFSQVPLTRQRTLKNGLNGLRPHENMPKGSKTIIIRVSIFQPVKTLHSASWPLPSNFLKQLADHCKVEAPLIQWQKVLHDDNARCCHPDLGK